MLGFLGMTADISGFVIDPPLLVGCVLLASFIQLIKNEAEKNERKLEEKETNTK